jgi:hypothetical protein
MVSGRPGLSARTELARLRRRDPPPEFQVILRITSVISRAVIGLGSCRALRPEEPLAVRIVSFGDINALEERHTWTGRSFTT